MLPPEEGLDRFRDKKYGETHLPILPSGSRGITMTEAGIATIRRRGISVDDDKEPAPDNVMKSDDVLPIPSSLTSVFCFIYPWCQSGNFPVGRSKLKATLIPRIQHTSCLDFFMKL